MHYYQHNIKTFNSATRFLTRVERSLYRDLIELYYDTEQPLISDKERLQRLVIANTEEERNALDFVLSEFFTLEDDGFHHEYCDLEIEKYKKQHEAKSLAGKASAAKRKQPLKRSPTKKNISSTDVQQSFNECSTNHKPITNNQEPIEKSKPKKSYPQFAKTEIEKELYDYRKKIGKELKTETGMNGLTKAISETAEKWKRSEREVIDLLMENEWLTIKPNYSNPFQPQPVTRFHQPMPNQPKIKILNAAGGSHV